MFTRILGWIAYASSLPLPFRMMRSGSSGRASIRVHAHIGSGSTTEDGDFQMRGLSDFFANGNMLIIERDPNPDLIGLFDDE
jgi:hypothetical protein